MLIEAFMYRSHPLTRVVADWSPGRDRRLQMIRTSFCFRHKRAGNVRFDRSSPAAR